MPSETLFTAARRALRDYNIDMNQGGLISPRTEQSMLTLSNILRAEEIRLRNLRDPSVVGTSES